MSVHRQGCVLWQFVLLQVHTPACLDEAFEEMRMRTTAARDLGGVSMVNISGIRCTTYVMVDTIFTEVLLVLNAQTN